MNQRDFLILIFLIISNKFNANIANKSFLKIKERSISEFIYKEDGFNERSKHLSLYNSNVLFDNFLIQNFNNNDSSFYKSKDEVACSLPVITSQPANVTVCDGNRTVLSVVASNATAYQWQVDSGSGFVNLINSNLYSSVYSPSLKINYTQLGMNNFKYRCIVTNGEASCTTISNFATLTVLNTPAPTGSSSQTLCYLAKVSDLKAIGTAIKWYESATSTSVLNENSTLVSGKEYFATQTISGCESPKRLIVKVTLSRVASPTISLGSTIQKFCNSATVSNLRATGTAIKWYESLTSTTVLSQSTALVSGKKYYATQTINGCESDKRLEVTVNISIPSAPTISASESTQTFCNLATVANLKVTGLGIKWYESATSTSALASNSTLVTEKQYFATQTINGCESLGRTAITVKINKPNAPTGNAVQTFCNTAKLSDLRVVGTGIKWYSSNTSTTVLPLSTILVSGRKYYATQTVTACESVARLEVTVELSKPAAPTVMAGEATQTFCISGKVSNLKATGTAIKWYDSLTSTAELSPSTALISGRKYYASQTIAGCESATRLEVTVFLSNPTPPTVASGDSTQTFCNSATVNNLRAIGTGIKWYESETSTSVLASNTTLVPGKKYYATQTIGGCESFKRLEITVILAKPSAPILTEGEPTQIFCNSATLSNLKTTRSGLGIKWYETATSTTVLPLNTILVSGKQYFASQTIDGCESIERTGVTVKINKIDSPIGLAVQTLCNKDRLSDLIVTGTGIKWYATSTSTFVLPTNTVLISGRKYYATQTILGCESATRLEVSVVILSPSAPTVTLGESTQTFCNSASVSNLKATGTGLKWYDSETSTTALASNTALVSGKFYYASQTVNGCESLKRVKVYVSISKIAAPTITASDTTQTFCNVATISNLKATGYGIKWYETATSTSVLASNTELITGKQYFASQTIGGCESIERKAVTVKINKTETPTGTAIQSFCETGKLSDLSVIGTDIKWYSSSTSTVVLSPNTVLISGRKYYATQTLNNCESLGRLEITAIIGIEAPTGSTTQTFCNSAKVSDLKAIGKDVKWYVSATSRVALADSENLVSGRQYFASQTIEGCQSLARLIVKVTISQPSAPTVAATDTTQTFCNSATISNLKATGTGIKWYDSPTSTTVLSLGTALVSEKKYYATQTIEGCESLNRLVVMVNIAKPSAPTVATSDITQIFCNSATISNLKVTGYGIKWYETATSTSVLASNTELINGKQYFASQTIRGCESIGRTGVTVKINKTDAPTGSAVQTFCKSGKLSDLIVTGTGVKWYPSATSTYTLTPSTALVSGNKYYASQTINNCESTRRLEVAVIIGVSAPTGSTYQTFCNSGKVSDLRVIGTNIKWYSSSTSTLVIADNTVLESGKYYYATQTVNGCESSKRIMIYVRISKPSAPTVLTSETTQTFCNSATVSDLRARGTAIKWYDLLSSTTPLSSDTALVSGKKYYASQTIEGCESIDKVVVTVKINVTQAPTGTALQSFNTMGQVSDLKVTGLSIKWYASASSTSVLPLNSALISGNKYYATQTINNCESINRFEVTVTIVKSLQTKSNNPTIDLTKTEVNSSSNIETNELDATAFSFYPNPVIDELRIDYKEEIKSVKIFNLSNKLVYTNNVNSKNVTVNMDDFSAGIYLIEVSTSNNSKMIKIVKK